MTKIDAGCERFRDTSAAEALYGRVRFKNILYATDFSPASQLAMRYVVPLAHRYGSQIFVLHVIPEADVSTEAHGLKPVEAEDRETIASMVKLEPRLKGVPHEFMVRKGHMWAETARIIEEKTISLVLMGTHGRSGARKVIMGSVAEEIFRKAPCPVLTVGPNVCGEPDSLADIRTILCPIDFRPESLAAIPYATSLAEQNQARLYLLQVSGSTADELPDASTKAALRALVPPEAERYCEPKALVEYGAPAETILDSAAQLGVDLIALGVKPATQFAGKPPHRTAATAYRIVTEAICPVLTVRART